MIRYEHVYSDSHVIEYRIFKNGEFIGTATIYPQFKEIRISIMKSEVTVIDGEIKEELSYIHEDDRELVTRIAKELFERHF